MIVIIINGENEKMMQKQVRRWVEEADDGCWEWGDDVTHFPVCSSSSGTLPWSGQLPALS